MWYHSLEPINLDWQGLQNSCSDNNTTKVGNTWEQLFHTWSSFNFDDNIETIDAYITHTRESGSTFRLWRNHTFWKYSRIHFPQNCAGLLFPIDDLRQAG